MEQEKKDLLKVLDGVLGDYGYSPVITWALRFFLRNPFENLILVDKEARILFADKGTEEFFGLSEGESKGKDVRTLIPDSALPRVLETGTPVIGKVVEVQGISKIVSAYPLIRDGEVIGGLGRLIFHSLEEVERMNRVMNRLKSEVKSLRQSHRVQFRASYTFENILGISPAIKEAIDTAKRIANVETDVLIAGESGTGKELFAHAIHNFINPGKPFVQINCPTIPFELAESEFFGYERGAFSGANSTGKPGKFELAHNGTVFLDEICSLPLSIQAKLLRTIQEREIERLGGTKVQKLNFRILATTNINLKQLIREGRFREDLYFRLNKATLFIPPLRERKEDIPIYVDHFLKTINGHFGTYFKKMSGESLLCLMNYSWPGNIRELINVLEQAMLKKWQGEELPLECLPKEIIGSHSYRHASSDGLNKEVDSTKKKLIFQALKETRGNKRRAAVLLGIPRSTLYKKIKEYNYTELDSTLSE